MASIDSKPLDEYIHDLVLILLLPFILATVLGVPVYLFLLETVSNRLPTSLQAAYEIKAFWWIFLIDALLTLGISGRLSHYVWTKEESLEMSPPPLRVIRKWGLVFCWSDNLTNMPAAFMRWVRRKIRRSRTRLVWSMRLVRNWQRIKNLRTVPIPAPKPVPAVASVPPPIPTPPTAAVAEPVPITITPVIVETQVTARTAKPVVAVQVRSPKQPSIEPVLPAARAVPVIIEQRLQPEEIACPLLECDHYADEDDIHEDTLLNEAVLIALRQHAAAQAHLALELAQFCRSAA
jgi:hypothetical protein